MEVTLDIVSEEVASVFVLELLSWQQWQDKVFWHLQGTVLSHTRDTHSRAIFDQYGAVLLPACFTEGVLAGQCQQRVSPYDL